ncbi:unnamed protein product, partial [Scytosiphon promiscuus]
MSRTNRRIDPLCLARAPRGSPAEQPRPGQAGRDKLGGIVSRSFSIESSAMMQVFYARWYVRVHGRNRKPWSSLYMDRRKTADGLLEDGEIPSGGSASSHQVYLRRMKMMIKLNRTSAPREDSIPPFCRWKAHVWERMLRCDFCLRVVSSGTTRVECVVCNIVVHAGCLRNATQTTAGRRGVSGYPRADSRDLDVSASPPSRPHDSPRDSGLLQPSDFPGGGCPRDELATGPRRTKWVCSHCLQEHLSSVKEKGECAAFPHCRVKERARFILSKGGFRAGPGDPEYELAQHQTLLDGVTFLQALWRGLRARRENEALNHNHFRAWRLDVLGLDGLPASTRGHDVRNIEHSLPYRRPKEDKLTCLQQQQSPRYRVVVTVIQDMAPVGIEASAPPVQLFRFDTPVLPASASAAPPAAAGSAMLSAVVVNNSTGNSGSSLSKKGIPRSSALSPPSASVGRGCPASSVDFNSEMFVPGTKPWTTAVFTVVRQVCIQHPTWVKGKPQTSTRKQRAMTKATRERKHQTSKDDVRGTAVGAVAPSYTFVGQAFAHLKADLCRGTSRSLSLALRPQYFPMTTPDHLPEGVTIRARVRPLSHVTSKCGYIHMSFSPGRLKCPRQRTSRAFAVLAGGFLSLYSKACSQKPPKSRLELRGASVWVKAEVMQVLVCLRTPDEMGRTNFQVHAETMVELNAW